MATTLPVPLVFDLPEGWESRDPDAVGAPGSAFVAGRLDLGGDHPPVITMDGGVLAPDEPVSDLAERSLDTLAGQAERVRLLDRRGIGSPGGAEGVAQAVGMLVAAGPGRREVVQDQVYLTFADAGSAQRAVVRLVLTVSEADRAAVLPDFQALLRSIALDET